MDCSLPSSFVHGVIQPRILEWGWHWQAYSLPLSHLGGPSYWPKFCLPFWLLSNRISRQPLGNLLSIPSEQCSTESWRQEVDCLWSDGIRLGGQRCWSSFWCGFDGGCAVISPHVEWGEVWCWWMMPWWLWTQLCSLVNGQRLRSHVVLSQSRGEHKPNPINRAFHVPCYHLQASGRTPWPPFFFFFFLIHFPESTIICSCPTMVSEEMVPVVISYSFQPWGIFGFLTYSLSRCFLPAQRRKSLYDLPKLLWVPGRWFICTSKHWWRVDLKHSASVILKIIWTTIVLYP